ncbi:hypothetical protein IKU74_04270 [bacterium]|nr:hypothetical protein [bacterium]
MDIITILVIFAIVITLSFILRLFFAITKVVVIVVIIALLLGALANWQKDNIQNLKEKYGISLEFLVK